MSFGLWIILAILLAIAELLLDGSFFLLSIALGALAAGLVSLAFGLPLQIAGFVIGAALGFAYARPVFSRRLHRRKEVATNADRLPGQTGRIIERVDPATGYARVVVAGDDWRALVESAEPLELGDRVIVLDVQGATLTVAPEPVIGR